MTNIGYHKTRADHCVFVKKFDDGNFLILLLYVDDMLIVGRDPMKIRSLKNALSGSFSMNAHCSRSNKEIVIAITRKVSDKGAPKIWHRKCETGRLDTTNKLQTKQKPEYEI